MTFVYPPPPSILLNTMSVVGLAALAQIGWSEVRGNHLKYSKFASSSASPQPQKHRFGSFSSRIGMLLLYTPAFLAAAASFFLLPSDDLRFLLLKSALALHFLKRIFEVNPSLSLRHFFEHLMLIILKFPLSNAFHRTGYVHP